MFEFFTPIYDTEAVRAMFEQATKHSTTQQDIWNLCRTGGLLEPAIVRRGAFDVRKTKKILAQIIRRRLAADLGRTSPRLLPDSNSVTCPHCKDIGVTWEGKCLCVNGHLW